jgi:hypothetical protein
MSSGVPGNAWAASAPTRTKGSRNGPTLATIPSIPFIGLLPCPGCRLRSTAGRSKIAGWRPVCMIPQMVSREPRERGSSSQNKKGETHWRNSLYMPVESAAARTPERSRSPTVPVLPGTEPASAAVAWSDSSDGVRRTRRKWRAERTVPAQLRTPNRGIRSIRS